MSISDPRSLDLPEPSADDQRESAELSSQIRQAITDAGGSIGFDGYMEQALYSPQLGYYSSSRRRFGSQGDFVTSPEISNLFTRCLARQAEEVFATLDSQDRRILEVGSGSGIMARDLITALEQEHGVFNEYLILERSAGARAQQRETLGALAERVRWLDDFPEAGFRGLIVGNELLDALPGVRFVMAESGPEELRVVATKDSFDWQPSAFSNQTIQLALETALSECEPLPVGYVSEFAPAQAAWVRTLLDCLDAGVLLLLDYGYPRREFYHPQRIRGTLACHYRHRMHEDPFRYPGLQDISVHVDFTAIAEAALAAQQYLTGYTTQANFLIAAGLLEIASDGVGSGASVSEQARMSSEIQRLTLPSQLGEAVKVMAISPDPEMMLSGFAGRDLSMGL